MHNAKDLLILFDQCFLSEFNTQLQGGADEPIYLPADTHNVRNRVVFTYDYYASALHEIAHWCVAGEQRRSQVDYGYWYTPDGRSSEQQAEFERVEVKPQALEWIFTEAVGGHFRVSSDNLAEGLAASDEFKEGVAAQARRYCQNGITERPARFIQALQKHYGVINAYDPQLYQIEKLNNRLYKV